jgi:succinate dehydrogenase/fumarate reductase-like Fe-S protein
MMPFSIKINGQTRRIDVDDDAPLLWVLRDVVGLTGTKFGCGAALCGACTVHVDGVPVRSCITPVECESARGLDSQNTNGWTSEIDPTHESDIASPTDESDMSLDVNRHINRFRLIAI